MKGNKEQSLQVKAAIVIQKWYRGHRSRTGTKKYYKRMNQRRKIIEQLVMTQEKYVHDLSLIISDFQLELFNSKILPSPQIYILFSNIDAIRKLNQHFFVILHNNFNGYWHYKVVFEDLKKQVNFFKIYFEYLNNFTTSMTLMKQLKDNNPKFKTFLINIKKNPQYGNLDLQDYLIKPVQRLPKYVLLFKLLLKKTDTTHPDYTNIKKLLEGFEQVNTSNNQKLNKLINNFKLTELEKDAKLPFHIAEPGTQFIMQQNVTLLTSYNQVQDAVMHLLNNRVILTKRTKYEQKFLQTVSFRYGVTIMQNEQQLYENCFTLQSIDGDSVTLLFQTQQEMHKIMKEIKEQIFFTEKKTYEKYAALQNINKVSESFINKMCRYDLMPEVSLLGTEERTDKMLKYTTYIVEVKVKNIRQKIFLRYSELLQAQELISLEFPNLEIKQSLYKTTWFLNHKPKTIEQRKMSIQKFLTQVLSKPEIIQSGGIILSKLGLPEDLYELPQKLKTSESFLKRSSIVNGSKVPKSERQTKDREGGSVNTKTRSTYRLSIFMDLEEENRNMPRKHSMQENTKSSVRSSVARNKLNVQQILYANELDLGHYVRYSENIQCISRNKLKLEIYIPWLVKNKILVKKTIEIMENQRVAGLINKLAREIGLNYHKDFRLFLQKDHAQRMLDDDQIITKVQRELVTGKYNLVLKKMIYIEREAQDREIKSNRIRLKIIASQVIYEVKKSKYRLNYSKFLTLSVLIGIIQNQSINNQNQQVNMNNNEDDDQNGSHQGSFTGDHNGSSRVSFNKILKKVRSQDQLRASSTLLHKKTHKLDIKQLAIKTRSMITNSYASFFQNDKVWIKDYEQCFKSLSLKLKKIAKDNSYMFGCNYLTEDQQLIWTSVTDLCYLSIVDQIRNDKMFGSMGYVVQISERFQQVLINGLRDVKDHKIIKSSLRRKEDGIKQQKDIKALDLQTMENRNVWLIVKWSSIFLYSINLAYRLYEIKYNQIENVICYPSSIYIQFKDKLQSKIYPSAIKSPQTLESRTQIYDKELQQDRLEEQSEQNHNCASNKSKRGSLNHSLNYPNSIKFKTTSSYVIRQLITYYKNYNMLSKKIEQDQQYTNSLIEMIQENSRVLNDGQDSFKYSESFSRKGDEEVQANGNQSPSSYSKYRVSNKKDKFQNSFRASGVIKMQQVQ